MSHLTETYKRLLEQQLAQEIAAGGAPFTVTTKVIKALRGKRHYGAHGARRCEGHAANCFAFYRRKHTAAEPIIPLNDDLGMGNGTPILFK